MLTIEEIREISFRRAGRSGYNAIDVDDFIDEVVDTVESLNNEKAELIRKMDILASKIEQYRSQEENVRKKVDSIDPSSNDTAEAKEQAALIIQAAESKSREILSEAEKATQREKEKFEALHAETAKLRKSIIALYKEHLAVVEKLPTDEDVQKTKQKLDEKYPKSVPEKPAEEAAPAESQEDPSAFVQEEEITIHKPEVDAKTAKFEKLKFGDNYDVE